jgi:hypothetical protein|tara:strand:- start:1379 stop:1777 length:399 start_codon:yes stop_codon:yes gene_type:complete
MALIPVKIQYKNKEEIVEFEDSLSFGQTEKLINDSVDLSDVSKPKIDLALYRMNLLVMTIKTAPFKTGDITTLNMLNGKLVRGILKEIVKSHPLTTYIEDWMETFISSEELNKLDTQSTTTVPRNSAGTKNK